MLATSVSRVSGFSPDLTKPVSPTNSGAGGTAAPLKASSPSLTPSISSASKPQQVSATGTAASSTKSTTSPGPTSSQQPPSSTFSNTAKTITNAVVDTAKSAVQSFVSGVVGQTVKTVIGSNYGSQTVQVTARTGSQGLIELQGVARTGSVATKLIGNAAETLTSGSVGGGILDTAATGVFDTVVGVGSMGFGVAVMVVSSQKKLDPGECNAGCQGALKAYDTAAKLNKKAAAQTPTTVAQVNKDSYVAPTVTPTVAGANKDFYGISGAGSSPRTTPPASVAQVNKDSYTASSTQTGTPPVASQPSSTALRVTSTQRSRYVE